jgi:hypothetical protein
MSLKDIDDLDISSKPSLLSRQNKTNTSSAADAKESDISSEEEGDSNRTLRRLGDDPQHNALEKGEDDAIDECPAELKTLRYKIMLMNGNTPVDLSPPAKNSYDNLQQFLEKERNNNTKENWSKLNKSVKNKKIAEFVDIYTTSNDLTEEEHDRLLEVLKQNMLKGKLTKNKEVNYDKSKGVIKDMPCLLFNKTTRHFTIKNMDAQKHSTTIKKASFVKATAASTAPTESTATDI